MGLFVTARVYLGLHSQSHWIITATLPAFLLESIFYLGAGFEGTRQWFRQRFAPWIQPPFLCLSAVLPYLVFGLATHTFERNRFELLFVLCAILTFWNTVLPQRLAFDVGFLVVAAAPVISRVFGRIFISPDPRLHIDILGHLMWIRLGITVLLLLRGWDPGPFSFWPRWQEWKVGFLYYVLFLVPIVLLALVIRDAEFAPPHQVWWQVAGTAMGTFFATLWVVALGEELFFRGVVERALLQTWRAPIGAVLVSALLFGSAHLWFQQFPNWRQAAVAGLLGVACGLAYWKSGSVRAPMVSHALIVTTWRLFFR